MKSPRYFPQALVLVAMTCSAPQLDRPVLNLFQRITETAERDARTSMGTFGGPLLIDVSSFNDAAALTTEAPIASSAILAAIGHNARSTTYENAMQCDLPGRNSCSIRGDGVLVHLDSLRIMDSTAVVIVTSFTGYRRPSGLGAICPRRLTLVFARNQGDWVFKERQALLTC